MTLEDFEKEKINSQKAKEEILKVISDNNVDSVYLLPEILGDILHEKFFDQYSSFLNNGFNWSIKSAASKEIGCLTPRILKACEWLIANGYNHTKGYNTFSDYYSAVMINTPECVLLLNVTDWFSYIVKIDIHQDKVLQKKGESYEIIPVKYYTTQMRLLMSKKDNQVQAKRRSINYWKWLSDIDQVNNSGLFKFKDERDDGYLISANQDKHDLEIWRGFHALVNYPMLCQSTHHLLHLFSFSSENLD